MRTSSEKKLLAALAAVAVVRLFTLWPAVIDDDEAFFAASANALRGPASFFKTALDDKPPGTVWFDAAVRTLTGPMHLAQWSRLAGLLVLALTAFFAGRIARRLSEPTGRALEAEHFTWLALALGTGAFTPKLFALTNEQLMLLPLTCAIWLALPRPGERSLWRALAAGAVLGAATWVKQTALLFALPVALALGAPLEIALAALAFLAVAFAGAWTVGLSDYWQWTFQYPRQVLVAARRTLFTGWSDGIQNTLLFTVALLPLLLRAAQGGRRLQAGFGRRVLVGWAVAALGAIAAGAGLFPHYFLLALPPLAILAGCALAERRWSRGQAVWIGAAYAGCAIAATLPLTNLFWGNDLPYFSRVASRIDALTRPEDRVFLWGGSPVPLAMSGRKNATRFVTSRFVVQPYANEETLRLFQDELTAHPPALVVDLHARGDDRQNLPPRVLPWFSELLARRYRVLADPSLPWARFYLRDDVPNPDGELCASRPLEDARAGYPKSLAALEQMIARARAGDRPADPAAIERVLRTRFADEIAQTSCTEPPRKEVTRPPLALESRLWWVELAIVELQPVILPRRP
jgi:hypothetical protein